MKFDLVGSVVLYNTDRVELERAIAQFLAIPLSTRLFIIDNSPKSRKLDLSDSRITYHFSGKNLGYGRAHNIALRASAGHTPLSLVMNTDISYSAEAVLQLRDFILGRPSAGLVAPKIRNPDGSLQHVCRLLPKPSNMLLRRFLPNSSITRRSDEQYELRWWDHEAVANIPYLQGSFMLMRTDLANAIGGFDERFFLYGEDIDLTRRMHSLSETLYVPQVQITHQYRRFSSKSALGTWYGIQNNYRYFNKWGWFTDTDRTAINNRVIESIRSAKGPGIALSSITRENL